MILSIFEVSKMKAICKIENNGIRIPIDKLKGFSAGQLVEIEIKKVYADNDVKKSLNFAVIQ